MASQLIIRGAAVCDGTGAAPLVADVTVCGERIAAVGPAAASPGDREIDGRGLTLAPGFIDVHSHDDLAVLVTPDMDFKVMQGVTTEVVGNCGLGAAPHPVASAMFRSFHPEARLPEWRGYAGYLRRLEEEPPSLNVVALVGHGTLRYAAMGGAQRAPDGGEMRAMAAMLREGIEAGAAGLSTGLIYEPGRYATTAEIVELAGEMRGSGGLYATHMRDEAAGLLAAVEEALRVGEEAGVPVQISHHKASGKENWGRVHESLRLIEAARRRGLEVTADQYPYTSGSTVLFAILQNNALGTAGSPGGLGRLEARDVLLASVPRRPQLEGMSLQEICEQRRLSPEDAARDVLREEPGAVAVIESMDEDDVCTVMRHRTTMIGSDGVPGGGKPHPRLYGTFPRVLGRYVRERGVLSLEAAVHRMTGFPAAKFGLVDRGVLRPGAYADLVLFDAGTIADTGTYQQPRCYPRGIRFVFVNGIAVVADGAPTGARPGRPLRREEKRM